MLRHTKYQGVFRLMWHMKGCRGVCQMAFCKECKKLLDHFDNCFDVECTLCLEMHQLTTWRFRPDPQMTPSIKPQVASEEERIYKINVSDEIVDEGLSRSDDYSPSLNQKSNWLVCSKMSQHFLGDFHSVITIKHQICRATTGSEDRGSMACTSH